MTSGEPADTVARSPPRVSDCAAASGASTEGSTSRAGPGSSCARKGSSGSSAGRRGRSPPAGRSGPRGPPPRPAGTSRGPRRRRRRASVVGADPGRQSARHIWAAPDDPDDRALGGVVEVLHQVAAVGRGVGDEARVGTSSHERDQQRWPAAAGELKLAIGIDEPRADQPDLWIAVEHFGERTERAWADLGVGVEHRTKRPADQRQRAVSARHQPLVLRLGEHPHVGKRCASASGVPSPDPSSTTIASCRRRRGPRASAGSGARPRGHARRRRRSKRPVAWSALR